MKASELTQKVKTVEQELQNQLFEQIRNYLGQFDIELTQFAMYKNCDTGDYNIKYKFCYNGFAQSETAIWDYIEEFETVAERIKKHILYIGELREKFSDYAALNDYIQTHREFKKVIDLEEQHYNLATVSAELTSYLKLPNTTSCGLGGGDYEIKRTPKRVEMFKNNINTLINCFIDYIAELRDIAKGLEDVENQLKDKKD